MVLVLVFTPLPGMLLRWLFKISSLPSMIANCNADLERINTSYVVLLPKKIRPGLLRTFALFACKIALSKLLQKFFLIDYSPLSPVSYSRWGRSDQFRSKQKHWKNYAYAMDLLLCCFKRKIHTIVLKIDFHKAFDSVRACSVSSQSTWIERDWVSLNPK